MRESIQETLEQRGATHGDFPRQAILSQKLKKLIKDSKNWNDMTYSHNEAIELILHKLARICEGDAFFIDSWRDIIGYSQLIINGLENDSRASDVRVEKISMNTFKHTSDKAEEETEQVKERVGWPKTRKDIAKEVDHLLSALDD